MPTFARFAEGKRNRGLLLHCRAGLWGCGDPKRSGHSLFSVRGQTGFPMMLLCLTSYRFAA
jgi:hypothetical protein